MLMRRKKNFGQKFMSVIYLKIVHACVVTASDQNRISCKHKNANNTRDNGKKSF